MLDKMLTVITANRGKLREIEAFLGPVESREIDLPELQSTSGEEVALYKLTAALAHHSGPILVEDTGLTFEGMGSLPGPLIKWFVQNLDLAKLACLAQSVGSGRARAQTWLVVGRSTAIPSEPDAQTPPFEYIAVSGITDGTIVAPRGSLGFGWDAIFQPDGSEKTFAEMTLDEKQHFSMRRKALTELQKRLDFK